MNSDTMKEFRLDLLNGNKSNYCSGCYYEDQNNKVSGRLKQLLKSGINVENFSKTICASPHYQLFEQSFNTGGNTDYLPVDLQIDLGNTCNSGCVMCSPMYSSKLVSDYAMLSLVEPNQFKVVSQPSNWSNNPTLVEKFVNELSTIPNIKYLHFIGGETFYLKSFYTICNRLIELGLSSNIILGTTTNCTVVNAELDYLIKNFKEVHLGLSIETFTALNDYIRWPSNIAEVTKNIEHFMSIDSVYSTLRITPNVFTINQIDTVFEFMLTHAITAESCNILQDPSCLRIELLPDDLRAETITKIKNVIDKYDLHSGNEKIINRRNSSLTTQVITDTIFEYKNLLEQMRTPIDVENERANLVKFVKAFESIRGNSIFNYLPNYERFLRSYGY